MISYNPFWETLKKSEHSTYTLIRNGIAPATINRLKHNKSVSVQTLNDLCQLLNCHVEDIIEIVLDKKIDNQEL